MKNIALDWIDYECIDAGYGEKLERWGNYVLRRPDPQAIWSCDNNNSQWRKADAIYHRSTHGGGQWQYNKSLPDSWLIHYNELTFKVSPTNFKHTGLFPEQAANWNFLRDEIKSSHSEVRILNLFAYTGAATMACSSAGAKEVVHVDASKGMIEWAKENMKLSQLSNNAIRFINDDTLKFVQREKRRGRTYHGIIMDPPSYGRGPNGEMWKCEENLQELIEACLEILDDQPLLFLVNAYTTGFSRLALDNILKTTLCKKFPNGTLTTGEIGLPITRDDLVLPCGIYGRWVNKR